MTKVKLRKKAVLGGKESIYLDFYPPILHPDTGKNTRWEFLGLYTYKKPKSKEERKHNDETL